MVLLDAGMVTHMSQTDQQNMLHLFRAFTKMDGKGVAEAILDFSGAKLQLGFMQSPIASSVIMHTMSNVCTVTCRSDTPGNCVIARLQD